LGARRADAARGARDEHGATGDVIALAHWCLLKCRFACPRARSRGDAPIAGPAPESSYAFARNCGIWRAGGLALRPFAGEQRIHDVVAEGACEQHRLAQRALALKAQPLCQRPAALVFDVQANLDAIEPPL